jgi:hypothetical protein
MKYTTRAWLATGAVAVIAFIPGLAHAQLAIANSVNQINSTLTGQMAHNMSNIFLAGSAIYWWRHHNDHGGWAWGLVGAAVPAAVITHADSISSMF